MPMAAYCVSLGGEIRVTAAVAHPDGSRLVRDSFEGSASEAAVGISLADNLIRQGADSILRDVLASDWEPVPMDELIA